MLRKGATLMCAAVGLLGTLGTSVATADTVEPLNQYVVSGQVNTDALARAGFDLREASVTGQKGKFFIVARPSRGRGAGEGRRDRDGAVRVARTMAAPTLPLAQPTHGYDVFRPWSLTPAPCPGTCSTPLVNLKTYYHQLARDNPDVVKEMVIGQSVLGQDIMAYKVTKDAKRKRDGGRPAVLYNSTQHAREWIADGDRAARSSPTSWSTRTRGAARGSRSSCPRTSCGSCPSSTSTATTTRSSTRARGCGARTCATSTAAASARTPTASTRTATGRRTGTSTSRARPPTPSNETYHGTGPASEPEVQAMRGLERRIGFKFQIDYHSFAQLILYPEGWQVETLASDAPLMAAIAGDDDNPAVARLRPGRLGGALHHQRRRHRRLPARLRHAGVHRRARRRHRPGRGRHRRRAGLVQPGRLRVPGLRGRHPGRVPEEPRVLARPRALGEGPGQPGLAPLQQGAGVRADDVPDLVRRSADRRGQREEGARRGARLLAGQRRRASTRPRRASTRAASAATTTRAPTTTTCAAWSTAPSRATP